MGERERDERQMALEITHSPPRRHARARTQRRRRPWWRYLAAIAFLAAVAAALHLTVGVP